MCIICLIIHFGHEQCQENNRYINHLVNRLIYIHDVYIIYRSYYIYFRGINFHENTLYIVLSCMALFCLNNAALRYYISLKVSINQDVMMQDAQ